MSRLKTWFVAMLLAIAVLVLATWRWAVSESQRPVGNANAARFVTSKAPGSGLVAGMWVDSARVYTDQTIRMDLVFENHTSKRIDEFHFVDFQIPGFEPSGDCWKDGHPACLEGATNALQLRSIIEPGASVHIWARLKPSATGRYGMLAVYSFSSLGDGSASIAPSSLQRFTPALFLQPIEVTTPLREAAAGLSRLLALPLLGALILFGVQAWDKDRDKRKQQAEKESDERKQQIEKERERTFTVWTEQLKRVFEYTQQHYLPIYQSISDLQKNVGLVRGPTKEAEDYAVHSLFSYLMFRIQIRRLALAKGGFFLSTHDAEDILSKASELLKDVMRAHGRLEDDVGAAMSAVNRRVDLAKFTGLLASPEKGPVIERVWQPLLAWILEKPPHQHQEQSFDVYLALLTIMQTILEFEWDRPFFRYWYAKRPEFSAKDVREVLDKLPQAPQQWADFKELVQKYMADVATYLEAEERQSPGGANS